MRKAGIREARQHLSRIIDEVRRGREVVLTDRGRPVARLVPPHERSARPLRSRRRFRSKIRLRGSLLSATVAEDREDRF